MAEAGAGAFADEILIRVQQPYDDHEDQVEIVSVQATFSAERGIANINLDPGAPNHVKQMQEAAIRVMHENMYDRDKVALLSEIIKNALSGTQPGENHDVRMGDALNHFCECLVTCLDQRIDDLARDGHEIPAYPDQEDHIGEYLRELGLNVESILIECISVMLKFESSEKKLKFIRSVIGGDFVLNLRRFVLSKGFQAKFTGLGPYAKKPDSTEYLDSTEREITEQFLSKIFSELKIYVWMSLPEVADVFYPLFAPTLIASKQLKVRITAACSPRKQKNFVALPKDIQDPFDLMKAFGRGHGAPQVSGRPRAALPAPTSTNRYAAKGTQADIQEINQPFTQMQSSKFLKKLFFGSDESDRNKKDKATALLDGVVARIPAGAGVVDTVASSPNFTQAIWRLIALIIVTRANDLRNI